MIDFCYSRYNDKKRNGDKLWKYREYKLTKFNGKRIGTYEFKNELTFTSDTVDKFPAPILQSLVFMLISCKLDVEFNPDMYTMRHYDENDSESKIFALIGKRRAGHLYTIAHEKDDRSIIFKNQEIFREIYCVIELPEALVIKKNLEFPEITHVSLSTGENPKEIRVETDGNPRDLPRYDDVDYPEAPSIKVKEQDRYLENDRENGTGAILYATKERTKLAFELLWQSFEE
jgi:hypothetical protein